MGVTVATVRVAAATSTGTQDLTTSDLGGLTPKAVLLVATRATADGTAVDGAGWYMGASDGTNEWTQGYEDQHAQASMDSAMTQDATANRVLTIYDGSADDVVDGAANFDSFITNGVRIDWVDAPAAAYLITATFFAGTDLSANVGTVDLGNTADALVPITSIGFEADVVVTALLESATTGSPALGMGFVHNDRAGTVTQRALAHKQRSTFSSSWVATVVRGSDCVAKLQPNDPLDWHGSAQSFDSSGFDIQLGNGRPANNHFLGWLALRFGASPVVASKVYTLSTPTSTGSATDTGAGFEPQVVMYLPNLCAVVDTVEQDADAGSLGLAVIDADEQYCNSIQSADGAADSDTQSLSDDQAVNLPLHDGAAGMAATFTAFTSTGVTLNWTDVEASARRWPALAIEVSAAGGGTDDLTATGITTGAPTTGTPAIGQAHTFTISDLATAAPTLGTPALGQAHALAADDLTTGSPALGAPAIAQAHALEATALATGAPDVDSPAIAQEHALSATGLTTGAPDLASPALGSEGEDALTATDLVTGSPALGSPAIGQVHALTASALDSGAPDLGSPALALLFNLAAAALDAGTPSLGTPSLGQAHVLTISNLDAGAPATGNPALGQTHSLTATGLTTSAPALGAPALDAAPLVTPAERVLAIAAETRTYEVAAESRTLTIEAESRTYTV